MYDSYVRIISVSLALIFLQKYIIQADYRDRDTNTFADHYNDVIMGTMASQITSLTIVNRLFWRRSKKTSKLRVTALCAGNSSVNGEFPAQRASNAANISIWWRDHIDMFSSSFLWYRRFMHFDQEMSFTVTDEVLGHHEVLVRSSCHVKSVKAIRLTAFWNCSQNQTYEKCFNFVRYFQSFLRSHR